MGLLCSNLKNNKVQDTNNSKELLKWVSKQQLFKYHWWPMKESSNPYYNNLYCNEGGLDKYDRLFGTNSIKYQKENYFRKSDSTKNDAGWAGFCDKATTLACLYEYPRYNVKVKHNGQIVNFSPFDIEMLMIIACDNATKKNMSIFLGNRNNSKKNDNKSEPNPSDLFHILKIMCSIDQPFAMDIDQGIAVWNYPYNQVKITLHSSCPLPHTKLPDGETIYLNFIINSTSYPEKNQCLWGYINTKTIHFGMEYIKEKTEGWISKTHPDFIWKKFAKDTCWQGKCKLNPEINAAYVYAIYTYSLNRDTNTILEIV